MIRSRSRTYQQADAAEQLVRHLARLQSREGDRILRTWRQLAKGIGKDVDGMTDRQARNRYRGAIRNTIGYLIDWGILAGYESLYEPSGEGRCIVVRLHAGVAQSVRAGQPWRPARRPDTSSQHPPRRERRPDPQHFFSSEVGTPLREYVVGSSAVDVEGGELAQARNGGASARVPGNGQTPHHRFLAHAARRRAIVKASAAASLILAPSPADRAGAAPALAASSALLALSVPDAARVLFGAVLPDVPPRLTVKRQAQLEAAAARLDHYGARRGTWIEVAYYQLAAWTDERDPGAGSWLSEAPRSLGALALELRRTANVWRHHALEHRSQRLRPLTAMRERNKVKRWRRELRELERRSPGAGRSIRRPRDA